MVWGSRQEAARCGYCLAIVFKSIGGGGKGSTYEKYNIEFVAKG